VRGQQAANLRGEGEAKKRTRQSLCYADAKRMSTESTRVAGEDTKSRKIGSEEIAREEMPSRLDRKSRKNGGRIAIEGGRYSKKGDQTHGKSGILKRRIGGTPPVKCRVRGKGEGGSEKVTAVKRGGYLAKSTVVEGKKALAEDRREKKSAEKKNLFLPK